ncbi:MAG TPA: hypothetical protein VHZ78_11315 [Rhizomicrobium sp.]|jgi:hypothetical protein|nr:hypothetical protein [Rhizomicrobium sp.]
MKKFLYLYFGGNPPKSPEEGKALMNDWMAYFARMGDKFADPGAPIGPQQTVGHGSKVAVAGYTIVNAASLEDAVKLTDGHPHLKAGGTIEVCETMPIPM